MTTIAWTSESWNPIAAYDRETKKRGWFCQRVSPGCTNCYASAMNRYRGNGHDYAVRNADKVEIRIDEKALVKPLSWKKPRRIFVCSMTDLFLDEHTDEMIAQVYAVMALARRHTFQVLTKRPERRLSLLADTGFRELISIFAGEKAMELTDPHDRRTDDLRATVPDIEGDDWPLKNIWEGVSAEDQKRADERIPTLLSTPATIRWVSYEPALGPIDFGYSLSEDRIDGGDGRQHALDWIVVGGESGGSAREFNIDWARSTVAQCRAAGVPVFVKQMGRHPFDLTRGFAEEELRLVDAKGEDPSEWEPGLRVREFPDRPIVR
jgi:protein gp37